MMLGLGRVRVWGEPVKVLGTEPGTQRCQIGSGQERCRPARGGTDGALQKRMTT